MVKVSVCVCISLLALVSARTVPDDYDSTSFNGDLNAGDLWYPGDSNPPTSTTPPRRSTILSKPFGQKTEDPIHALVPGCDCIATSQYSPVCGSDGKTYKNEGLLKCYRECGQNVTLRRRGPCPPGQG